MGAELFTRGVIATFALLPVSLTSQRDKDRLQCRGSLKKSRRGSLCKGLHISKVIPFSLPLSATNDLHDAARIHFHVYLKRIFFLTVTVTTASLLPCLHTLFLSFFTARLPFFFHFAPTCSTPLVTFKKIAHTHNYREKLHREPHTSNNERFGEKEMKRDGGSSCIPCAKHRHAARRSAFCLHIDLAV